MQTEVIQDECRWLSRSQSMTASSSMAVRAHSARDDDDTRLLYLVEGVLREQAEAPRSSP